MRVSGVVEPADHALSTPQTPGHATKPLPKHDAYAALRVPNYRYFAAGWLPASMGLQMQTTALAWEIYERTGDPLSLGWIGVARALPTILLALPAGQIVDRVDRLRMLINTQSGFAIANLMLTVGSIAWSRGAMGSGLAGLLVMYGLIALTGCARVFNGPSRNSLLPQLIPGGATSTTFHNAVTWNSTVFQISAIGGPLLAGLLIWLVGAAWPVYAIAAAASLWFGLTCRLIKPLADEREPRYPREASFWEALRPSSLIPGITEGVRHIWREQAIFGAITLDLLAVLLGGATALMPIFAKDVLHVGAVGLGALRAAPFAGALLMALVIVFLPPFKQAGRALLLSVAGFGLCTIGFGLSTNFWLSLALLATLGALDNISVVIRHVLVNVRTPDRLRGRVSAVNSVFIESSNELGAFESGLVAKLFTPVISVVSGGIGTVIVVAVMALTLPELRRLGRLSVEVKP